MTPEQILTRAARELIDAARLPYATREQLAPYADALDDALVGFDKRASFTVRFGDKSRRVAGYIVGSFGISDTSSGSSRRWHLSHLGTGYAMPGTFPKKSQAIAYAKAIEPLAPWPDISEAGSDPRITPSVVATIKAAVRQCGGIITS